MDILCILQANLKKASPEGEVVCEDPPSFFESPPPTTLPEEMDADAECGVAGRQLSPSWQGPSTDALSPSPSNLETARSKALPLSQLKSVSIKKLSLNRRKITSPSTRRSDPPPPHTSNEQGASHSTTQQGGKVKRMKMDGDTNEPLHSSRKGGAKQGNVSPVIVEDNSPPLQHKGSLKDGSLTPTQNQPAGSKRKGLEGESSTPTQPASSKGSGVGGKRPPIAGTGDAEADTPPLPSVHSRRQLAITTTKLPVSDRREAGTGRAMKLSRPARRNLSLSYNKKLGDRRQKIKVLIKPVNCDETIEIDRKVLSDSPPATSPVKKASKIVQKKVGIDEPPPLATAGNTERPLDSTLKETDPTTDEMVERGVDGAVEAAGPTEGVETPRMSEDSDSDVTTGGVKPEGAGDLSSCESEAAAPDTHMEMGEASPPNSQTKVNDTIFSSTADGKLQSDNLDEHQPKKIKLDNSENVSTSFKAKKRTVQDLRAHPPPVVFAEGKIPPAQYSKVILGSFNSYFSQLAEAQRQVLYRVRWGEPLKCSAKQPGRKRSSRRMDSHLKLSLKLGSPRVRRLSDSDFSLSEFSPSNKKQHSLLPVSPSCGGSGAHLETEEDLNDVENASVDGRGEITPPGHPDVGFKESPDVSNDAKSPQVDAVVIGTQEEEEEEEGSDSEAMEDFEGGGGEYNCTPQGANIIGTQDSPDPTRDVMNSLNPSGSQPTSLFPDVLDTESQILRDILSSPSHSPGPTTRNPSAKPVETDSQILHHILSSPSLSDKTPSPDPAARNPGAKVTEKEASLWLSARRPPPSPAVKKTRKRATPARPRASKVPKAKVAKKAEKAKRVGRSAAARLLQSKANASSTSSDDDDDDVVAKPTRGRAMSESRSNTSSEGEDGVGQRDSSIIATTATTSRSTSAKR